MGKPRRSKRIKESVSLIETASDKISGFIFMCNGRTKLECFRHQVFGLPSGKLKLVKKIKPGAYLFLFDCDLKLMYGVYKSSTNGGFNLVPNAFGGNFPAQVKFKIVAECLPVPENFFKLVLNKNYDFKHKFKLELSSKQVLKLLALFLPINAFPQPAPLQYAEDRRPPTSAYLPPTPAIVEPYRPAHLPEAKDPYRSGAIMCASPYATAPPPGHVHVPVDPYRTGAPVHAPPPPGHVHKVDPYRTGAPVHAPPPPGHVHVPVDPYRTGAPVHATAPPGHVHVPVDPYRIGAPVHAPPPPGHVHVPVDPHRIGAPVHATAPGHVHVPVDPYQTGALVHAPLPIDSRYVLQAPVPAPSDPYASAPQYVLVDARYLQLAPAQVNPYSQIPSERYRPPQVIAPLVEYLPPQTAEGELEPRADQSPRTEPIVGGHATSELAPQHNYLASVYSDGGRTYMPKRDEMINAPTTSYSFANAAP